VLLSNSTPPVAKLADFGSSAMRREGSKTRDTLMGERGTVMYMDPVLFDPTTGITAASDVYSFGVMAWQVLSGCVPYEEGMMAMLPATATALQKVEALRRHVTGGGRPPVAALVERGVPPAVVALVERCWAQEVKTRPAMAAVHLAFEAAAAASGVAGGGAGTSSGTVAAAAPAPAPPTDAVPPPAPAAAPLPVGAPIVAPASDTPVTAAVVALETPAPLAYEWDDQLVLRGHTDWVWSLALLPNGLIASGDESGTVRLRDVVRGGEATVMVEKERKRVFALAVLSDGCHLAAGLFAEYGKVGAIVKWDTGVVPPIRRTAIDFRSGVRALAVLRDGCLAAGCADGGVRLVEVSADACGVTTTLTGHTNSVYALAVLPDGTLVSGSHDRTVRLWDVGTTSCVVTLVGHTSGVYALAVLADGRLASGSDDRSVRLWDVATRACVGVLEGHTRAVYTLAALPDGRLVSGSFDGTIRVWDTRPAAAAGDANAGILALVKRFLPRTTPAVVLEGHTVTVCALQPLPGGRLASASADNTVRLWRLPA